MAGSSGATRVLFLATTLVGITMTVAGQAPQPSGLPPRRAETTTGEGRRRSSHEGELFKTSTECVACHNGLTTAAGEDVSIGVAWRSSMMANAGRDPYWMGSVRREVMDHPTHQADIEDECSICHMPMARASAVAAGRKGEIFKHLTGESAADEKQLAADGVSCTLCHQIGPDRLGTSDSFTGGFVLNPSTEGVRAMLGPYEVKPGHATIMQSSTGFRPNAGRHLRDSELCATCHTLITQAFGASGEVVGRLPEQVPYQEWLHSAWRTEKTCQQCHMPAVDTPTAVTSVFGAPRDAMGRHTFLGGNFFMLRLFNRHRDALGVLALPQELEASARATIRQLQSETATLSIDRSDRTAARVTVDLTVTNATGHKLPTGYPARRVWVHLTVRDTAGRIVFESGAPQPSGAIAGNDNDDDPARVEPHHEVIHTPDQVQVYESVMSDVAGHPTTGLLSAVRFLKDNRLLPRGFDKRTAADDIAVRGDAAQDDNFSGTGDRLRYDVSADSASGPLEVVAELLYQPIGFRWARNLSRYNAPETTRFVSYYDGAAAESFVVLARRVARVE